MQKNQISFGCQTYTWQMSYDRFSGDMEHVASVVKRAGMNGVEPEICMLGSFFEKPHRLKELLDSYGVELGALCLVADWKSAKETESEHKLADDAIKFVKTFFPSACLVLCQMPGKDRNDLLIRQKNAVACINAIAERAAGLGVKTAFHPNSPAASIFRIEEDYDMLLNGIDSRYLGFAPDAGHIAKGGMDPVLLMKKAASLIKHVHFKDMDEQKNWVEMGKGIIDFKSIISLLNSMEYKGWIMIEDESAAAESDPDSVVIENARYIKNNLIIK